MGMLKHLRRKVGALVGGFEGGLSARRLKTFHASRAHVNTLIQAAGADIPLCQTSCRSTRKHGVSTPERHT